MIRRTLWLMFPASLLAALTSLPCFAQNPANQEKPTDSCKIYFAVYWADSHIPGGFAPGMHKEQKAWYENKLKKKYPSVCFDQARANYDIIWSSEFKSYDYSYPAYHRSTTTISGDVNATATTDSYSTEPGAYQMNNVYMFIYPSARKEAAPPIFATHKETWWTYRAAHRQALDEALQFLFNKVAQ